MSNSPFLQSEIFLVQTIFDLAIYAFIIRFLLQYAEVNFYHPFCQFIVRVTKPLLLPTQKIIPSLGRFNFAVVFWAALLELVKLTILAGLLTESGPEAIGLALWSVGDLFNKTVNLYFYAIILQALLSWLHPAICGAMKDILYRVTFPLVSPFQRLIPPVAGIDFSFMAILLALKLLQVMIGWPLIQYGQMILSH